MLDRKAIQSVIDKPTRITVTSKTVKDIPGVIKCPLTDHFRIFVIFNHLAKSKLKSPDLYIRSLKDFDPQNFDIDLASTLHEWFNNLPTLDEENFNSIFSNFVDVIKLLMNKRAPFRKISRPQILLRRQLWISKGVLISIIKKKQRLCKFTF